jgi:hypothetical protein
LTPRQERVLRGLLSEPSVDAAARAACVPTRTVYRWLRQPLFQGAYQVARRDALRLATGRLQTATGDAVTTLMIVMRDSAAPHAARVNAARVVLDVALKATELEDIERRLADLEQAAARQAAQGEEKKWGRS